MNLFQDVEFIIDTGPNIEFSVDSGGSSGGGSYIPLSDKPSVNGTVLIGNKTSSDLKVQDEMNAATVAEIESILYLDI